MAIAAYFDAKAMTLAQYHEIHRRLQDAGVGLRDQHGRLHHSCFGEEGSLAVYDVWETPEAFEAFGAVLMPILAELGVEVAPPVVMPVNLIDQVAREADI
jgi:hypothetical protein